VELRRYWHLLRRRWILILISILIGAGIGYETTSRSSVYRTSAEVYVGTANFQQQVGELFVEQGLLQIELTYADMINSPVIAEKAVQTGNIPRTAEQVVGETKATVLPGTNLLLVTATDRDPVVAAKVATGVSRAFQDEIKSFSPTATPTVGTIPSEPAYLFQPAGVPSRPIPTGLGRKVTLGAVFGLVLAILLILTLDYLDVTIKSADELERRLDLPVLGVVPMRRNVPETVSLG
jgi:capsular polysaccharide biosynthesis protein